MPIPGRQSEDQTSPPSSERVGVLLSGGLDSAVLAGALLRENRVVQPLYIRGGLLWESCELAAVRAFLDALSHENLRPLVVLEMPLADLYGDHWSLDGAATPAAGTPDEAVYLPGRNPLLLVKAAVWCQLNGITQLALAPLESNPFGDATDAFFEAFERAIGEALGASLRITRPFSHLNKAEVVRLGAGMPLELTFSCIHPLDGAHCGACNKCEERQAAFRQAGVADPTPYAAGPRHD